MLGTGLRIGEALAIRWQDVDLGSDQPKLTVTGTVVYVKGQGFFRQEYPKTESSTRALVLPPFAVGVLLRRRVEAERSEHDVVFPSHNGKVHSLSNFHRQWRAASKAIGFAWVDLHDLRKTVATLLDEEASLETAKDQLGHASAAITQRHYVKPRVKVTDNSAILQVFAGPAEATTQP